MRSFSVTTDEAVQIMISVFAISFAFTLVFAGLNGLLKYPSEFFVFVALSLVTIGSGFILHEMSHKLAAVYYGAAAEFRMWVQGLVFMLLTSLIGVLFAAPGAVYIYSRNITRKQNCVISLAGPTMNLIVMSAFLVLSIYAPITQYYSFLAERGITFFGIRNGLVNVWEFGVAINLILALFNMLPMFILDGSKVYAWNKFVWFGFTGFLLFLSWRLFGIGLVISWVFLFAFVAIITKVLFRR